MCSCDDQQRFFKEEVEKALQQAYDECREELRPQQKQLLQGDPQKVQTCFQEHLNTGITVMECVNEVGRNQRERSAFYSSIVNFNIYFLDSF
jgi:hypothetical protein